MINASTEKIVPPNLFFPDAAVRRAWSETPAWMRRACRAITRSTDASPVRRVEVRRPLAAKRTRRPRARPAPKLAAKSDGDSEPPRRCRVVLEPADADDPATIERVVAALGALLEVSP